MATSTKEFKFLTKCFLLSISEITYMISDLLKLGDVYNTILEKFGAIEILVNNVGGSKVREDFSGTSLEGFRQTFDLNLFGSFEMMKLVTPEMKQKKWGRIINIASIWANKLPAISNTNNSSLLRSIFKGS